MGIVDGISQGQAMVGTQGIVTRGQTGTDPFTAIGGSATVSVIVDELYERLSHDTLVRHHFHPDRLDALKSAQRAWFAAALSGASELPSDLAATHAHIEISDLEVTTVLGHLEAILAGALVSPRLRRAVLSLVSRLWHARLF
jgi:truncated hemoglobin YjbI